MSPEEHAVKIREATELILRLLAAQKYADIVTVLDVINDHVRDIQTHK